DDGETRGQDAEDEGANMELHRATTFQRSWWVCVSCSPYEVRLGVGELGNGGAFLVTTVRSVRRRARHEMPGRQRERAVSHDQLAPGSAKPCLVDVRNRHSGRRSAVAGPGRVRAAAAPRSGPCGRGGGDRRSRRRSPDGLRRGGAGWTGLG